MKSLLLAAAAFIALSLSACSTLESPAAQPFDAVAVAVAVDTVVGTNASTAVARASAIKSIAQQVLAADTGATATIASLEAVASAKIVALKLPPGDAAAAALLLTVVDTAVTSYVASKTTGTTADANVQAAQVAIATVSNWVIAEATRLGAP
jgi:hypothetical protein